MYEELIKYLRCHQNKEGKPCLSCSCQQQQFCDTRHDTEAADALEDLITQISALQAENAELREENGCLQHNVAAMQATLDQQAKNCEKLLAEKDREIASREQASIDEHAETHYWRDKARAAESAFSRVEAERDAANDRGEYFREKADEEIKIRLKYGKELERVTTERDAAHKEIERMKDIMCQHGIMVIPSKYPGGRSAWNIRRGAQEGEVSNG